MLKFVLKFVSILSLVSCLHLTKDVFNIESLKYEFDRVNGLRRYIFLEKNGWTHVYNEKDIFLFSIRGKFLNFWKKDVISFKLGNKVVITNEKGKWLISANKYDYIVPLFDNLFAVKKDLKKGVINAKEKWLYDLKFDNIFPFFLPNKNIMVWHQMSKKNTTYSKKGISKTSYSSFSKGNIFNHSTRKQLTSKDVDVKFNHFTENIIIVKNNNKYGAINSKGKVIIPTKYERLSSVWLKGKIYFKTYVKGKGYGLVDYNGDLILIPNYKKIWLADSIHYEYQYLYSNYLFIKNKKGKWGLMNSEGEWIFMPKFQDIKYLYAKKMLFWVKKSGKWGLLNQESNWVIEPKFQDIEGLNVKNFVKVKLSDKWGVLNEKNNWVIEPKFEDINELSVKGFVRVKLADKWGILDFEGKYLLPTNYNKIIGMSKNKKYIFLQDNLKQYYVMNLKEDVALVNKYSFISKTNWENIITVSVNNEKNPDLIKKGLFDLEKRKWLLKPKYNRHEFYFIKKGKEFFLKVRQAGKWGLLKKSGEWAYLPKYDNISIEKPFYDKAINLNKVLY